MVPKHHHMKPKKKCRNHPYYMEPTPQKRLLQDLDNCMSLGKMNGDLKFLHNGEILDIKVKEFFGLVTNEINLNLNQVESIFPMNLIVF